MVVTIGRNIRVTDPTDELIKWCDENLVIRNPDYIKKQRMNFWLGKTPEWLHLYEWDGDDLILPYGTFRDIREYIVGDIRTLFPKSPEIVNYNANVPLYDYQQLAVEAMFAKRCGILQSKAGSGKTQMGIALVAMYGQRSLWLTHTHDLLLQSKERAEQYMDPSLIGTITAGKVNIGKGITFATVQTMANLDLPSYRDIWNVIIVDECHRVAGTPTVMTQFGKVLNNLCAAHKYGLSATVHRADGMIKATFAYLGQISYTVPDDAVADKVMTVKVDMVETAYDIDRRSLNPDGTINYTAMIENICGNYDRNKLIADKITENAGHSQLILSARISQLERIRELLPDELYERSALITGKMTTKKGQQERAQAIEQMRTGEKTVLFATYNLCKEGLDIPRLDRLYLASPQTDYAVITQSVGRIARTAPDKEQPVCYDFVDTAVGYLTRAYKKRCTTYKKIGCEFKRLKK